MDDAGLPPQAHALALAGLARLNRMSFGARSIWNGLESAGAFDVDEGLAISLLDLATGGGDIPVALGCRARRRGISLRVAGADRSRFALHRAAMLAHHAGLSVEWIPLDVLSDPIPATDWITCSLFLHHLSDAALVTLLRGMVSAARRGIIINDLERSTWNRGLVWLGARLASRSPVVHRDSDRSVRAGFTLPEIRRLAAAAGLIGCRVERRFPCRFQLTWTTPR